MASDVQQVSPGPVGPELPPEGMAGPVDGPVSSGNMDDLTTPEGIQSTISRITGLDGQPPEPQTLMERYVHWLGELGGGQRFCVYLAAAGGMLLLAWLANLITRKVLLAIIKKHVARTKVHWDDILLQQKVFHRISHLAPALLIYYLNDYVFAGLDTVIGAVETASLVYMLLVAILTLDALLNGFIEIYRGFSFAHAFPIKSFVQVVKIIIYFICGIVVLSMLIDKDPTRLFAGMGAMTAVLMLIFKDSILGFVSGIQLTTNKMVRLGDWIEMPRFGADGDVIDISLTTVKVQNWDKTISTIPTYALVSDSFKNWRGMSESAGRRIKRSVCIDMNSIRFCDEGMLERMRRIQYIADYLDAKKAELAAWNSERKVDDSTLVNGRRLTNIGTFRAYVEAYLKHHELINQNMTFLVRQLQPTEHGLPLEIYVFCSDKVWAHYEAVQADIFDHMLAVLPEFDLRVFQNPTGADWGRMIQGGGNG